MNADNPIHIMPINPKYDTSINMARTFIFVLICIVVLSVPAAYAVTRVDVTMRAYNVRGDAVNLQETTLNSGNVRADSFGKLFSRSVIGHIYAQVLYVSDVNVVSQTGAHSNRNIILVATMRNQVYAFDADDPAASSPLWHRDLGPFAPMSDQMFGQRCLQFLPAYLDISDAVGIVSTPVVDRARNRMFVVALNKVSQNPIRYQHRLWSLDISTGNTVAGPIDITASKPGTGAGSANGIVRLNPMTNLQRASLALVNNVVYIGFGSYCDTPPYQGWVLGYHADSLQQVFVWCSEPNQFEGSIWHSGYAPSFDASGNNMFLNIANGPFAPEINSWGSCFVRIDVNTRPESVAGWVKPADPELGLTGAYLMPETEYIMGGGKTGMMFVADSRGMGPNSPVLQTLNFPSHIHGNPVFWRTQSGERFVYIWGQSDSPRQYALRGEGPRPILELIRHTGMAVDFPGGYLTLSADGQREESGVLWGYVPIGNSNHAVVPGRLIAFRATNLGMIWDSDRNAGRDSVGSYAKFNQATVTSGRVFLPTFSALPSVATSVHVYGLLHPIMIREAPTVANAGGNSFTLEALATGRGPLTYNWHCSYRSVEGVINDGVHVGSTGDVRTITIEPLSILHDPVSTVIMQCWTVVTNEYGSATSGVVNIPL